MFYEFDLAIPAGTTEASPATVRARLNKGYITRVAIMVPPGPAGLAFTAADRGEGQLWPSTPGAYFKGDGLVIEWQEDYALDDEPLELVLRGWSPNARFAHTITWRFELLALERAQAARAAPGLIARMARALLGPS